MKRDVHRARRRRALAPHTSVPSIDTATAAGVRSATMSVHRDGARPSRITPRALP